MRYRNSVLLVFAFTICAFECGTNLQQSPLPSLPATSLGITPTTSLGINLATSPSETNSHSKQFPPKNRQQPLNSLLGGKGNESPQTRAILEENRIVKRSMGRRAARGRRMYGERKRRRKSVEVEDTNQAENAVKPPMPLRQKVYLLCLVSIMSIFLLKRKYDQRVEANLRKESSFKSPGNQESKNSIEIVRQKYLICEPIENVQSTPKFGSPLKSRNQL